MNVGKAGGEYVGEEEMLEALSYRTETEKLNPG